MKHPFARLKAVWFKVPKNVRKESYHVALTFAVTFAATAAPALPAVVSAAKLGHLPDFTALRAVIVAAAAAGLRAAVPVARSAVLTLVPQFFANRKAKKAAKFMQAVEAYVAGHPAVVVVHTPAPGPSDPTAPRGAVA